MKYFVQAKSKKDYWMENWNYRFEIYDYEEKTRIFFRPHCNELRNDTFLNARDHERNVNKIREIDE